jgi:hypothetical protein
MKQFPKRRLALQVASFGHPSQRMQALESAARILYAETDLDCRDVHDLVGLSAERYCGCEASA